MGRQGAGYIRHMMAKLRVLELNVKQVADELDVSERRVRQLYREYLESCALGHGKEWTPGKSGRYQGRSIPEAVAALWRKMLGVKPPAPYAFAASESLRLHQFQVDRATVRRWAFQSGLPTPAHPRRGRTPPFGDGNVPMWGRYGNWMPVRTVGLERRRIPVRCWTWSMIAAG